MIKVKKAKTIYDPYEIMPSYGENSISTLFTNLDLLVDISFDSSDEKFEKRFSINFIKTSSFSFSSFPGVDVNNIEYEKYQDLGSLVEYQDSDIAKLWNQQLPFFGTIRHYQLLFLSENKRLEVFATGVKIVNAK